MSIACTKVLYQQIQERFELLVVIGGGVHWEPEEDRRDLYRNITANTNLLFIGYSFPCHLAVLEEN